MKRDENKNSRAAPIGRLARLAQQRQRRSRLGRGRYYRPCAVVSADVVHGRLSTSGAGYGTALKVVRSGSTSVSSSRAARVFPASSSAAWAAGSTEETLRAWAAKGAIRSGGGAKDGTETAAGTGPYNFTSFPAVNNGGPGGGSGYDEGFSSVSTYSGSGATAGNPSDPDRPTERWRSETSGGIDHRTPRPKVSRRRRPQHPLA